MSEGVSIRGFARLIGVSEGAVRKAIKAQRIKLSADGKLDPDQARTDWLANADPARTKVRAEPRTGTQVRSTQADEADADEESGQASDFNSARTREMGLKIEERALRIAERRKQLVPVASVKTHIEKAFIGYRQAMQRLPNRFAAQIAAEVGCDAAVLDGALSRAIATVLDELSSPVVRT
jgi:hypothetical protein